MHRCFFAMTLPIYLDSESGKCFHECIVSQRIERPSFLHRSFLKDGPDTIWFPWTGSRIQRTLVGLGRLVGGMQVQEEGIALKIEKMTEEAIREAYRKVLVKLSLSDESGNRTSLVGSRWRSTSRFTQKNFKPSFSRRIISILKGLLVRSEVLESFGGTS